MRESLKATFMYAKGKQNTLEGYFVRCKSDVTNYYEMPVELRIHIPFFFFGPFNRTCTSVMLTRSEQAVIFYVFYYFILQKPNLQSFSFLVRSRRGNLRDV